MQITICKSFENDGIHIFLKCVDFYLTFSSVKHLIKNDGVDDFCISFSKRFSSSYLDYFYAPDYAIVVNSSSYFQIILSVIRSSLFKDGFFFAGITFSCFTFIIFWVGNDVSHLKFIIKKIYRRLHIMRKNKIKIHTSIRFYFICSDNRVTWKSLLIRMHCFFLET